MYQHSKAFMSALVLLVLVLATSPRASLADVNVLADTSSGAVRARVYIPMLINVVNVLWPSMSDKALLPAQVEQETCASFRSSKCWNPRAELKTSREYGWGLAMITVTPKFNNFLAAREWDVSLSKWQWEDRFNAEMQLRALVAYDRNLYRQIRFGATERDKMAFMFSAYNGGLGGLLKDRRMCVAVKGCDPERWFGHIEKHSFRAKTATKGYGKSFFEINREYVKNILDIRSLKYRDLM